MRSNISFYRGIYKALLLLFLWGFAVGCTVRHSEIAASNSADDLPSENAININTATVAELEAIPHIGRKLAGEIVEFRGRHGAFRRAENLMLIRGISDKKFREIRAYVRTN